MSWPWPGHLGMEAGQPPPFGSTPVTMNWNSGRHRTIQPKKTNKNNIKRDLYKDYMPGKDLA